jgi:transposase
MRRYDALSMVREGIKSCVAARIYGVSERSMSRWFSCYKHRGWKGVKSHATTGPKPSLSIDDLRILKNTLVNLPPKRRKQKRKFTRFAGKRLFATTSAIQKLIVYRFKVRLSRTQVWRTVRKAENLA